MFSTIAITHPCDQHTRHPTDGCQWSAGDAAPGRARQPMGKAARAEEVLGQCGQGHPVHRPLQPGARGRERPAEGEAGGVGGARGRDRVRRGRHGQQRQVIWLLVIQN